MQEIAEGRLTVAIDTEIIQEILYRYGAIQHWDMATTLAENTWISSQRYIQSTPPTSAKPSNFSKSTLPKELRREMFCTPP
jgi:hypothetical protein